jgi:hypothetical protein
VFGFILMGSEPPAMYAAQGTKKMAIQSRKSNPVMKIDYQNPVKMIGVSDSKLHSIQRAGGMKR